MAPLVAERHYLRSAPAVALRSFAVCASGKLRGAAIVTVGARRSHRLLQGGRPGDVVTLSRLWLDDALERNSESRVLSVLVRLLRAERRWKLLVTFADPAAGHTGTIYRAAGFLYLGQTLAEPYVALADGAIHHPRTIGSRYGTNNVGHLSRTGVPARRVAQPPKLRYAALLDPSWAWRLAIRPEPYPRDRAPPPEGRSRGAP